MPETENKAPMISVDEALQIIRKTARLTPAEEVAIADAAGRTVAEAVLARITHLPYRASAMDGYAVRHVDASKAGARLSVVGEAAAGAPFARPIEAGEAVRIFTGGVVPDGADHVVIQEEVERSGDKIVVTAEQDEPGNIRPPGADFHEGDELVRPGDLLTPIKASWIASANVAKISAHKRPRVFYFANGDELAAPGADLKLGQVISSTPAGFGPLIASFGAEAAFGGVASDSVESVRAMIDKALEWDADLITPLGGASVGDYDLVKPAFRESGFDFLFEKIAVKPGKPTWFAQTDKTLALGLPGNPASTFACAILFVRPLLRAMLGDSKPRARRMPAKLSTPLPKNGPREHYLRALYATDREGAVRAEAFSNQDSSLLTPFVNANCLIRRAPNAPAAEPDDLVEILPL